MSSAYVSFGLSDPQRLIGWRGGGVTTTGGLEAASGTRTLPNEIRLRLLKSVGGSSGPDESGDGGGSGDD